MIIQLKQNFSQYDASAIENKLALNKFVFLHVDTGKKQYYVCNGKHEIDLRIFGGLKGVDDIFRVTDQYKLVSSQWRIEPTVIDLGDGIKIGKGNLSIMAGPCAIESEDQVEQIVAHLVKNKVHIMRGGVFKPRSSPYSFRGLGLEGLQMFSRVCRNNGIKIITEVMELNQVDDMIDYVDIFQVGARNSQNFNLLDALGGLRKPVLLKRGISGTLEELLQSAEYMYSRGNDQLMLCERGIRSFENTYRNTFDINAIAVLKEKSHLPVIADPSHGVGIRRYVPVIALAASVAGADGLIYEVHPTPELARSDAQQTLNFEESARLIEKLRSFPIAVCN
ncbi:MAG TPA: 3-deoxy-7-phosphoheptulonate synthase [Flavobacteriales bacterium]|nr:3-deoxy-7-phosphoheptulonate synthase [Flavobacteriales bacterium]